MCVLIQKLILAEVYEVRHQRQSEAMVGSSAIIYFISSWKSLKMKISDLYLGKNILFSV